MKVKKPIFHHSHVMLIDDNELDNFINEKMIEASHFSEKVYVHTSARSALEFLLNLEKIGPQYAHTFPEVIFIDINMPMIDGFQFVEQFRQTKSLFDRKIKLVILTSSVSIEDRHKARKMPVELEFYNKPLTKQMLSELIRFSTTEINYPS